MSRRLILVPETLNGRLLLALSVLAVVLVIQAILGASPALALSETPGNSYMTDGKVYATALSEDRKVLYIGGEFTEVRQRSGVSYKVSNVAAINVKTGAAIRTWRPKVGSDTSYVFALEAGERKLYAGGGFSKVNGAPRKNLAAFSLKTGALDRHWKPKTTKAPTCKDPKCSHKVRALDLASGRRSIFVGGSFSHVSGTNGKGAPRQSVARLYTATGNLHPWKIPSGTIQAPQTAWDLTATRTRLYGGFGSRVNYVTAF